MGEEAKEIIMSRMRRSVLLGTLSKGSRFDGRKPDEMREADVSTGVIKTAEGSALGKIGQTMVLASVKFDTATPFPDREDEGIFITNAELLPTASPVFETGPPGEKCIELARVVDRAVRSSEAIDLKSFFIEEGKVLGLFLDLYVLNYAGNFIDAATLAATSALLNTKLPKIEDGKIVRGEYTGPLNPKRLPFSVTFNKVGDYWLVDPERDEEVVAECVLTIAATEEHVCAIQKGKGSLTREELFNNIDVTFKRADDLRKLAKERVG